MPAYLISFIRVEDAEVHARDYMPYAHPLLTKHGGKPLAVTDEYDTWEGSMPEGRMVLVEFPTKQHADAFYNDPDYQPYKAIRQSVSTSDAALFDGLSL